MILPISHINSRPFPQTWPFYIPPPRTERSPSRAAATVSPSLPWRRLHRCRWSPGNSPEFLTRGKTSTLPERSKNATKTSVAKLVTSPSTDQPCVRRIGLLRNFCMQHLTANPPKNTRNCLYCWPTYQHLYFLRCIYHQWNTETIIL